MIKEIDIEKIRPNPSQPRKFFDKAGLQELADSIKEHGLLTPILVRIMSRDIFEIVHGERRWRACKLAGLEKIRAEVRELSDEEAYLFSLIENIQRNDLTPIEEGEAFQSLLDEGLTQKQLGERIGKSQSYIAQKLRLLNLPPGTSGYLSQGAISEGHARQLLRLKNLYPETVPMREKRNRETKEMLDFDYINYHLELMKPEFSPPVFLLVGDETPKEKLALVANAIYEIVEETEELVPQWYLTACFWASMVVLCDISVSDLQAHISAWHERYVAALFWWEFFGPSWLESWKKVKKLDVENKKFKKWIRERFDTPELPTSFEHNLEGAMVYADLFQSNSHEGVTASLDEKIKIVRQGNYVLPSAYQTSEIIKTSLVSWKAGEIVAKEAGYKSVFGLQDPDIGKIELKENAGEEITQEERIKAFKAIAGRAS